MLQVRKSIVGSIARREIAGSASIFRISRCFQSSSPTITEEATVPGIKASDILGDSKSESKESNGSNRRGKKYNLNYKLRDISMQIRQSVLESKNDLSESLDVLEEGLAYLREVQLAEKIKDEDIYSLFQPILYDVFTKAAAEDVSTGNRSLEDILNLFIEMRVAHQIHFTALFAHDMASYEASPEIYHRLLALWVKFLEYNKISENPLISKYFGFMRTKNIIYNRNDMKNLAFYVYVQSCIAHDVKFSLQDAQKLLQTEDLPSSFQVGRAITSLNLSKSQSSEFPKFSKALNEYMKQNLDPNGQIIMNRINSAIAHNDVNLLNRIFDQIKETSEQKDIKVKESTLVKLMDGYYECKSFENVFAIFESMLSNGIQKPTISSWEFLFKSMGHPTYTKNFTPEKKKETALNLERAIKTMLESGVKMTPKTLSIVVASFANLNRFDLVDSFLEEYSSAGKGLLPVIHSTRNNILIGHIINKQIEEAEQKLKTFMNEDRSYKPSSSAMNTFLSYYARSKNYNAVDGILKFMNKNNIPEEIGTYTIVIDIYFKLHRESGLLPSVDQLLEGVLKSRTITLNEYTFTSLIDGLVKDGANLEAARILFEYASKKYRNSPELFTSMLKGELDFGLIGNAELIFERYIGSIKNDTRIWNMMIRALLSKHEDLAMSYYANFTKQAKLYADVEPNFFTYYFLLTHFIKRDNKQVVQFLIDEIARKPLNELGLELPKVLRSLTKNYRVDERLLAQIAK